MSELISRAFDTSFKAHEALIHKLARRGYGRLMQLYVAVEYEDVFQEMCLTYVKAANGFDPSKGITFTAYLGRAIWNEFNKFAELESIERTELHVSSFENLSDASDCEEADLYETIDSGVPTPEEILENKQETLQRNKRMNATARFLVKELMKPSKCVLDALNRQEEHDGMVRRGVTIPLIARQHGLNKKRVRDAKSQLNQLYGVGLR